MEAITSGEISMVMQAYTHAHTCSHACTHANIHAQQLSRVCTMHLDSAGVHLISLANSPCLVNLIATPPSQHEGNSY